jgi:hypothetical protein
VRVTAIATQLVFEHALRIRVKAETPSSPAATPTATPDSRSEVTTPESDSAVEINIVSEDAGGGSDEGGQSTTAASSIKGKRREEAPGSDSCKKDGSDRSSNLVGRMNNLVSTDLENLIDGRDFLPFCSSSSHSMGIVFVDHNFPVVLYFPGQVAVCIWFLYNILGWSAFVGMVVMIALFPIPGTIAGKIQKVQKESMMRVRIILLH